MSKTDTATSNAPKVQTPLEALETFLKTSLEELLEIGRKIKSPNLKHWVRLMQYVLTLKTIQQAKFDFDDEKSLSAALAEISVKASPAQKKRMCELFQKISYIIRRNRSEFFKKGIKENEQLRFQSEVYNLIDALTLLFIQERENLLVFHQEKAKIFETFNEFVHDFNTMETNDPIVKEVMSKLPRVDVLEEIEN